MTAIVRVFVALETQEPDLTGGSRVVGNIYPATSAGTAHRGVLVPCGHNVTPADYPVDPGRYVVSATLPSGVELSGDVEVADGEDKTVRLDATDSPHESQSWQYLLGNIEPYATYWGPSTVPVPRSLASQPVGRVGNVRPPKLTWIGDARRDSCSFEAMLAWAEGTARGPLVAGLAETPARVLASADMTDGVSHLFRFGPDGPLSAPGPSGRRQFALVELAGHRYLVTLPLPWRFDVVEVMVNARQSPTGSAVSLGVRDRDVGAGLGYLSRSDFAAAARLFGRVEGMLFEKWDNPLAAAAGAYVLVGSDLSDEPRRWDPWLANLREFFGWLSDGSILWAARRLRAGRTERDRVSARDALLEAWDRGVPFYTLGLTWLIDGLSEFPDDLECQSRLAQARRLAWAADTREPFVILRLTPRQPR